MEPLKFWQTARQSGALRSSYSSIICPWQNTCCRLNSWVLLVKLPSGECNKNMFYGKSSHVQVIWLGSPILTKIYVAICWITGSQWVDCGLQNISHAIQASTCWGCWGQLDMVCLMMHLYILLFHIHWFRQWLVTCLATRFYLNQC